MGGRGQSMAGSKGGVATPSGKTQNSFYKPINSWKKLGATTWLSDSGEIAIDKRANGAGDPMYVVIDYEIANDSSTRSGEVGTTSTLKTAKLFALNGIKDNFSGYRTTPIGK